MSRAARPSLSACVIAKNEVDRIGPCLESVAFCDEIVVLDSGSTDGTQELCRAAGARVVETDWPGWVAQKNRAVAEAKNDWILSLDADERVDAELRAAIERLRDAGLDREGGPGAYEVTRRVFFLGRWIAHGGWYPEWRKRLFDRRRARWGGTDPHDHIETDAPVARIREGHLEHFTYRSIADQVARINLFSSVGAEEYAKKGRRGGWLSLLFRPPYRFLRMYVFRLGFLDGRAGFLLAIQDAYYVFLKYAKLWERGRRERSS